ncbi:MAG: HEAT repeat domain-containing protein, partial [Candidatus Heimdallarchaeota archaeon]|nr:HEAT repeat domain-containing protein [Candidatus Heimdallarchaeota archaeon]
MIKFVTESLDVLKQKYKLTSRVALRINTLLMKKIGFSGAVIEMINEIKVLEKFVLDKRLQLEQSELNHEKFNSILEEYNADEEFDSLAVNLFENPQGIKIICLEDEISLENINIDDKADNSDVNFHHSENFEFALSTSNQSKLKALVEPDEVNAVFSMEEIAKLKVLILTSTNSDEKIEALRKLMLLSLEPEIKGGILLQALQDDDATVRSQAAKGLKILGLSEAITDAIMKISSGSKGEQLIVIESLKEYAKQARVGELGVLFAVMLGTLRSSKDLILLRRILDTLIVLTPILASHSEPLLDLDRQLSRILLSFFKELNAEVYRIYKTISLLNLTEFKNSIIDHYKNLPVNNPVRNFYLSLIGDFFIEDDELIDNCVSEMVDVAATGDELDASTARLASSIRIYGEKAIPHIVEKLCKVNDDSKVAILVMLSRFSKGIVLSENSVDEIVKAFTEIYPSSGVSVRLTILESPFSVHEDISEPKAKKFAKVIIDDIHEHKLERNQEILLATLRKLKFKVLDVLENAVENAKYVITRLKSAEVIGRIGEFIGDEISEYFKQHVNILRPEYDSKLPEFIDDDNRSKLMISLNRLVSCTNDDSFPDKSPVFIAIGKLIYSTAPNREETLEFSEMLLNSLRSSYAYSIIEA